jgi:hypothetical protein
MSARGESVIRPSKIWPNLANAIGSPTIPATNNAVELVIQRFDQHYQNFCSFEFLADAQRYLAVFEKLYRFTPFSQDAQPRIRVRPPCNWSAVMSPAC